MKPRPISTDPSRTHPRSPEPRAEARVDDGVDVTLIRWTPSLTPQERIDVLQANADALARLRNVAASER